MRNSERRRAPVIGGRIRQAGVDVALHMTLFAASITTYTAGVRKIQPSGYV
jgi:hypothetical protein